MKLTESSHYWFIKFKTYLNKLCHYQKQGKENKPKFMSRCLDDSVMRKEFGDINRGCGLLI